MIFKKFKIIPRLVVFDLDHTLWPFGVDNFFYKPPYRRENNKIFDSENKEMNYFDKVPSVLESIRKQKIDMAVASRTEYPEGAFSLLKLFKLDDYFKYKQIYPGTKTVHFEKFKNESRYQYNEMLFFDDEQRNIDDTSPLGVTAILVDPDKGVTLNDLTEGLEKFAKNRQLN